MRVGLVHPTQTLWPGLGDALAKKGLTPETPTDPAGWVAGGGARSVVVSWAPDGAGMLSELHVVRPDLPAVAVVTAGDVETYAAALRAGFRAAASRDLPVTGVVDVICAAMGDRTLLPASLARALAAGYPAPDSTPRRAEATLSPREVEWLRALARSATVASLARRVGCSEREMYRLLAGLYTRMGVAGRTEALIRADRLGLLD